MITSLLTLEYADRLRDGTDKINANFEALRLYLNSLGSSLLFTGNSSTTAPVKLRDVNNRGYRLTDNTTTLFKATVVASHTDVGVPESAIFEVSFGVDVRNSTPTLIGDLTIFAYHEGLEDWEIDGVDFDGPYMYLMVKAKPEISWAAFISATTVEF